MNLIFAMLFAV